MSFTPNPNWILFDGFWRDANIWIDDQPWNDSAGRRREVHASAPSNNVVLLMNNKNQCILSASAPNFAVVTDGPNYCIVAPSAPNAAIVSGANEAA